VNAPTESYRKVFYDLRPAKQIERRMIIDALQVLAEGGFRIRDYQYTGFGSIYFVDFLLFHRLLGISRMLSVEYDESIRKRVHFNKPFGQVNVEMGPISKYIPALDRDVRHILWLDYDFQLRRDALTDTVQAAAQLSPGSLLLVTVDVEPPDASGPASWKQYFEREAGDLLPYGLSLSDFAQSDLPHTNAQILFNAIRNGITGRANMQFVPLFNFDYRDGHRMLTVGGMLCSATEAGQLNGCAFGHADYIRRSTLERPYEIRVPRLTRKERLHLDSHMPCPDGWTPSDFELPTDDVTSYRRLYRYYPAYAELMF
jgi:hypothetical protein